VGTTLHNFAVHTPEYDELKSRLLRWLSAKGFEQASGPALFQRDREVDDERGLCLLAKDPWVVVLYSHAFTEGERVRFELTRPGWQLLNVWTFDSDAWGYLLLDDGEPVTAFTSDPRYPGLIVEEGLTLSVTDDPGLLCRALRLGPLEGTIARLHRKRAVFKEFICYEFCKVLGVEPACYDYRDLEDLPAPLSTTAGGWQVEHFRFVERNGPSGEATRPLHAMVRKSLEQEQAAPPVPPELEAYMWRWRVLWWVLRLVLMPVGLVLGLVFRLALATQRWPLMRRRYERSGDRWGNSPLVELLAAIPPVARREGNTLFNDNHRCQITLPAGAEADDDPSARGRVFRLKVAGRDVFCAAVRPRAIHTLLRETPHTQIRDEELFFAGTLQARAWTAATTYGRHFAETYSVVVQTPRAFYYFSLGDREPLAEDAKHTLRKIGESFRTF
jgi:hypothetical protein